MVMIRDWRLGLLYNIMVVIIVLYVIVFQVWKTSLHLATVEIHGFASLGISKYGNEMVMKPPPTIDGHYIDGCEEPRIKELPTHFVRMSTFQSSIREGPAALFFPTNMLTRDNEACDFQRATAWASDKECEVFRTPAQTYGEAFYKSGASEDLFNEQYFVVDPVRHVLVISHAPAIGQFTAHTKDFRSDFTEVKGFARWQGTGHVDTLRDCNTSEEVIEEVRAGRPARNLANKYDYLPLPYLMDLAGVTSNCSHTSESLTYVPLMNGMSIRVNVRYSNAKEWSLRASPDMFYTITADAVRNVDPEELEAGEKEDTSFYWEQPNFENTETITMKLYGIRVMVATSSEISYFDPIWISAVFLPQFLALITVATTVIRSIVIYGASFGGIATFFSACNLCRPSRTFSQLCALGSRGVWYYKFVMRTTPNLAAIDFMLRSFSEHGEVKKGHLISAADANKFKGDKSFLSAFNDPWRVVQHDLPDHEMEVQLYNFYRMHKSKMTSDARRLLMGGGEHASEHSSDEDIMAATTSRELQAAFKADRDDRRVVTDRDIDLLESGDEGDDSGTP